MTKSKHALYVQESNCLLTDDFELAARRGVSSRVLSLACEACTVAFGCPPDLQRAHIISLADHIFVVTVYAFLPLEPGDGRGGDPCHMTLQHILGAFRDGLRLELLGECRGLHLL